MEKNDLVRRYKMVVIGGSAGSLEVLFRLLPELRQDMAISILIVIHRRNSADSSLTELLATKTSIPIREVDDKDFILPGHIYLAPSDYHVLIEKNFTFALDYSEKVNFSRPSLDVTFESAAETYGPDLVGIILSGANEDGTKGFQEIKKTGGLLIAQDPLIAQMPVMPQHAITHAHVDFVYQIGEIAEFLNGL